MKRPTLSLGGVREEGRSLIWKGPIRELRGPRMDKGKRPKVYQEAKREVRYMPWGLLFAEDGPPQACDGPFKD